MDASRMNYRQSLAPSACIHLTEEDDEPPPNLSRRSDNTTTSPSIEEPFPKKNKTGCPLSGIAFIFEARSTFSPVHVHETVKRFLVKFQTILPTLRAAGFDISGFMEKFISIPQAGLNCSRLKTGLSEDLS